MPKKRGREKKIISFTLNRDLIGALRKLKTLYHISMSDYVGSILEKDPKIAPIVNQIRHEKKHTRELNQVMSLEGKDFETWVREALNAKKPSKDLGVDGIINGKIPVQVKALETPVSYDIMSQFYGDVKFHPDLPKPIEKMIIVSKNGFDDKARSRAYEIEKKENIKVELLEPINIINGDY